MKLDNLNRAKDLLAMRNAALRLIEENTKALTYMKKYTWDCGYYPFDVDSTHQNTQSCGSVKEDSKFVKRVTIDGSTHTIGEVYCTIPLDLLIKATEEEIKRLSARIVEIDKEVDTL